MKLTRRHFVKSGAVVTLVAGSGVSALAAQRRPALVIYDSRLPRSLTYARTLPGPRLDIAHEDARLWRSLRDALPTGPVVGLTRWSDLVLVRGFAGDQRKRLRSHARDGGLFAWEIH